MEGRVRSKWLKPLFLRCRANHHIPPWSQGGGERIVRVLLTKTSICSFSYLLPGARCLVCTVPAALADSWPDIGPLPCLAFFKEVGSSPGVAPLLVRLHRHVWWADASRKRTSTVYVRLKAPCRAWSGISPLTYQALVFLPHSSKDHWQTQALPRRRRGDTVGRATLLLTALWGAHGKQITVELSKLAMTNIMKYERRCLLT